MHTRKRQKGGGDIHNAIKRGDIDDVRDIINKKPSSVNEEDSTGSLPLDVAIIAKHGNNENIIKLLLEKGADVNKHSTNNFTGSTPFHFAIMFGDIKYVKLLLENGADPTIDTTKTKESPLYIAATFRASIPIVKLLLLQPTIDLTYEFQKRYNQPYYQIKNETILESLETLIRKFEPSTDPRTQKMTLDMKEILKILNAVKELTKLRQPIQNLNTIPYNVLYNYKHKNNANTHLLSNIHIDSIASFFTGKKGSLESQKKQLLQNKEKAVNPLNNDQNFKSKLINRVLHKPVPPITIKPKTYTNILKNMENSMKGGRRCKTRKNKKRSITKRKN
jgi:hypothetical protein